MPKDLGSALPAPLTDAELLNHRVQLAAVAALLLACKFQASRAARAVVVAVLGEP